jgi:hypothetical protein
VTQTHGNYEFHYTDPAQPWFSWCFTRDLTPMPDWTYDEWFERVESFTRQQVRARKKAEDMFWKATQ